jgi:predicted site-specific integrase-resolvase
MPREIGGVLYVSAAEVAEEVGVSRQTLWRWRRDGKIPSGHRFRDRQIVFTEQEIEEIRDHANKVEPIADVDANQLPLF